jgi:hypothetical protein
LAALGVQFPPAFLNTVSSSEKPLLTAHEKNFQQRFRKLEREPGARSANGKFDPVDGGALALRAA